RTRRDGCAGVSSDHQPPPCGTIYVMELIRRLRDTTARAATRLGQEPGTHTRWLQRARIALYVLASVMLGWELYLSAGQDLPAFEIVMRVAVFAVLFGVGRWPVISAVIS